MKKYAVGHISFFDHILKVEIVEANTPKEALLKHSDFDTDDIDFKEWLNELPNDMDEIKSMFYNVDATVDVIEI